MAIGQREPGTVRIYRCQRRASILPEYLDRDYLQIYTDVKQAEFETFMDAIYPREYEWYL